MEYAGWRTCYYSVVLGIEVRTYFAGEWAHERAVNAARRDVEDYGYEGSAPVRVEYYDGTHWREHARYEASASATRCDCGADLSTYADPDGDEGHFVTQCDTPLGCGASTRLRDH